MFKGDLPHNCPPSQVEEKETFLYRLFVPDNIVESFKSYVELFPDNESYPFECKAHGLSFFDNIETAEKILAMDNNAGKVIVKVEIKKKFGVLTKKSSNKGHYTLWLYEGFDPNFVNFEFVNK